MLFGFNHETDDHLVLHYCVMYTKFYMYKYRLHRENELDIKIQIQKMFIAIIHNMNTWGRSCIRLSHQIALQYTTQLSAEIYTLVTVQHIRETNSTYYGNGSTKPFRIYGLHIWSTFNAYTKNRYKVQNIFNELCTQSYWCLGTRPQHLHWVSNGDTAILQQANNMVFLW